MCVWRRLLARSGSCLGVLPLPLETVAFVVDPSKDKKSMGEKKNPRKHAWGNERNVKSVTVPSDILV